MKPWNHVLSLHGLITNDELVWLRDNAEGRCVELGSLEGKSSCAIASSTSVCSLTCFDLWPEDYRWEAFFRNTDGFPITGVKMDSVVAAAMFPNNSIDFIFIDTNHLYEVLTAEIKAWMPKIRQGGLISGHDYANDGFPGVKQAVDEFFPEKLVDYSIWHSEKR